MSDVLRIGNCSGFYGDRLSAAREMVEGGALDVLTGDYLAELTLLILWLVRVIVRLNTSYIPEGLLKAEEEALAQRQRIQTIQEKLLGRLASANYRGLKRYRYTPLLALTVNERGLAGLMAAPEAEQAVSEAMCGLALEQLVEQLPAAQATAQRP